MFSWQNIFLFGFHGTVYVCSEEVPGARISVCRLLALVPRNFETYERQGPTITTEFLGPAQRNLNKLSGR
jgi:hypothetical protein